MSQKVLSKHHHKVRQTPGKGTLSWVFGVLGIK